MSDCDCERKVDDERYERERADDRLQSDIGSLERQVEILQDDRRDMEERISELELAIARLDKEN